MTREIIRQKLETMFSETAALPERATAAWVLAGYIRDQILTEEESTEVLAKIAAVLASDNPVQKLDAQWLKGLMLAYGNGQRGGEKKPVEAAACLAEGVDVLHPKSLVTYGQLDLGGSPEERATVEREFLELVIGLEGIEDCEKGAALCDLGVMYDEGQGVVKDEKRAIAYYQRAAELGLPLAMFNLGLRHEQGRGELTQSDEEAVKWYIRAAELGSPAAMNNLGLKYEQGPGGLLRSDKEAILWYHRALIQESFIGIEEQIRKAINAIRGIPHSAHRCIMALEGHREAVNLVTAKAYLEAKEGCEVAQHLIALLYQQETEHWPAHHRIIQKPQDLLNFVLERFSVEEFPLFVQTQIHLLRARGCLQENPVEALEYYRQISLMQLDLQKSFEIGRLLLERLPLESIAATESNGEPAAEESTSTLRQQLIQEGLRMLGSALLLCPKEERRANASLLAQVDQLHCGFVQLATGSSITSVSETAEQKAQRYQGIRKSFPEMSTLIATEQRGRLVGHRRGLEAQLAALDGLAAREDISATVREGITQEIAQQTRALTAVNQLLEVLGRGKSLTTIIEDALAAFQKESESYRFLREMVQLEEGPLDLLEPTVLAATLAALPKSGLFGT